MFVETDVSEQSLTSEGEGSQLFGPPRGASEALVYSHRDISFASFLKIDIYLYTKRTHILYILISLKSVIMAAIDLKALRFPFKDPKFIFFTDFDGTITLKDSNDFMVRHSSSRQE